MEIGDTQVQGEFHDYDDPENYESEGVEEIEVILFFLFFIGKFLKSKLTIYFIYFSSGRMDWWTTHF